MKEKAKKQIKKNILKSFILVMYVFCALTILIESCIKGQNSAQQSNALGQSLSKVINNFSKDQAKYIAVNKIKIQNPIDSEISFCVGDTYQLNTEIYPKNATNQSLIYSSSNPEIASISEKGLLSFNKSGTTTIQVISADNHNITDKLNMTIHDILPSQILVTLEDAIFDAAKNTYVVYLGHSYPIQINFIPTNTTNQSYTYEYDSDCIAINDDYLTALKYNQLKPITLSIKSKADASIQTSLKVVVDFEEVIEPTKLSFYPLETDFLWIGQTKKIFVKYEPIHVSFTQTIYESSNINVATIDDDGQITALNAGKTTITAFNERNPLIYATLEIVVHNLPDIIDFNIPNSIENLVVGSMKLISITPVPKEAKLDVNAFQFISSDPNVASVTSQGNVLGVQEGSTIIKVIYDNKVTKMINVHVIPKTTTENVLLSIENKVHAITKQQTIALSDLVEISLTINGSLSHPNNNVLEFIPMQSRHVSTSLYDPSLYDNLCFNTEEMVTYNPILNTITANDQEGFAFFRVYHIESGAYADFKFEIQEKLPTDLILLYDNKVIEDEVLQMPIPALNSNISTAMDHYHRFELLFSENQATFKQIEWSLTPTQDQTIGRIEKDSENAVLFFPINEGNIQITASITTPILKTTVSISLMIEVVHLDIEQMHLQNISKEIPEFIDKNFVMYKSDSIQLGVVSQFSYSRALFHYQSSNNEIAKINSRGIINAIHEGTTTITVTNLYGNQTTTQFELKVMNRLAFDPELPYFISSDSIKSLGKNKYELLNGKKATIQVNFSKEATYTKVTFVSSNEKVLKVGADGVIIPLKKGNADIYIYYTDHFSIQNPLKITLSIVIKKQPLINNLTTFTFYLRKILGHFSLFFIFSIFSLFTYCLFFKKDQWYFSLILHFIIGYCIALFSEIIQAAIPERTGAFTDVMIDYLGFLMATGMIAIIYWIHFIIYKMRFKNKHKEKRLQNKRKEIAK